MGSAVVAVAKATMITTSSMPSRFDRWKAWSQLVLRVNQRWHIRQQQEEFFYLVQNVKIGPNHDGLYCAQIAQTSIVVLRR